MGKTKIDIETFLNEQLATWDLAKRNYDVLRQVACKIFHWELFDVKLQFNPDRIRSAVAKAEEKEIQKRPCFLCAENRPKEQKGIPFLEKYTILLNPFPIFPVHLTIVENRETPQLIKGRIQDMLDLSAELPDFTILYNGPKSGASIPNHFHFQAGNKGVLPIEKDVKNGTIASAKNYLRKTFVIESADKDLIINQFDEIYNRLHLLQPTEEEPMFNLIAWKEDEQWTLVVFPRKQHRPSQFYASGTEQIVISPGVVDMGGMLITVREEDFEKINPEIIEDIFSQITLNDEL
jgi:ATP adenylyltransferase/5',5'''-P-1,P-4-tetraphosphate phosphorylase II